MKNCPVSGLKVIQKYSFPFLQESTESANTTIEDEDLKGKACRFPGRVSARRCAICCCFPSSICLPSVLLLSHMYILFCLFSPPNFYCPLQPFSPPLHPSFVKGVCFSISCRVLYLKCLLFRLSCSCCFFLSLVQCTARRFGNLSINSIWQPAGLPQNSEPKQAPNSSVQSKSVKGRRLNHPVLP